MKKRICNYYVPIVIHKQIRSLTGNGIKINEKKGDLRAFDLVSL